MAQVRTTLLKSDFILVFTHFITFICSTCFQRFEALASVAKGLQNTDYSCTTASASPETERKWGSERSAPVHIRHVHISRCECHSGRCAHNFQEGTKASKSCKGEIPVLLMCISVSKLHIFF